MLSLSNRCSKDKRIFMFEIVSFFGLLVSAVLIIKSSPENRINIYLSLFFLTISIFSLSRNVIYYSSEPYLLYLLFPASMPLFYLPAPLLYLYLLKSMKPGEMVKMTWKETIHMLPAVIMLINILPHLFLSYEAKMQFSRDLSLNQLKLYDLNTLFFPIQLNLLIRPFLGLFYSLAALHVYFKYKESYVLNDKYNVNSNSLSWFLLLIICAGLNFLISSLLSVYAASIHMDSSAMEDIKLLMLIPTFFLVIINVSVFFFPGVIYGIIKRKVVKKDFSAERLVVNDLIYPSIRGLMDPVEFDNNNLVISRKLADYFSSKPYLQPGFTLSIITQETNIPYHQLTIYYNNYLGINFNDWKNNARIDHAMDLIRNGRAKNLTLESIAYSCGFLSRSNFVNSFRKKTGLTPSEFLKSIPQESIVVSMDF